VCRALLLTDRVAPRAGAWIETTREAEMDKKLLLSPPARGRGLKQPQPSTSKARKHVAPRAGAWIETIRYRCAYGPSAVVAPRAGAWIETARAMWR